jgi:hypothetical protein
MIMVLQYHFLARRCGDEVPLPFAAP